MHPIKRLLMYNRQAMQLFFLFLRKCSPDCAFYDSLRGVILLEFMCSQFSGVNVGFFEPKTKTEHEWAKLKHSAMDMRWKSTFVSTKLNRGASCFLHNLIRGCFMLSGICFELTFRFFQELRDGFAFHLIPPNVAIWILNFFP